MNDYGYSLSDIAAATGNNNNGGFGENSGWWIILLLLALGGYGGFGNGFGGFGFGNGANNLATTDFVSSQFTQRDIQDVNSNVNNGFQNTNNAIYAGFGRTNDNIAYLGNNILENRYAGQLAACQTQRDILTQTNELNTNLLTTALQAQASMDKCCCDIKSSGIENTQKILDAMKQNTIDSLRSQVNDLKNTITAQNIGSTIINAVRPYPIPAWTVESPYVSTETTAG